MLSSDLLKLSQTTLRERTQSPSTSIDDLELALGSCTRKSDMPSCLPRETSRYAFMIVRAEGAEARYVYVYIVSFADDAFERTRGNTRS